MNDAEHGLTVQLRTNGHINGEWRYATPEEIKDAHPKCFACKHLDYNYYCNIHPKYGERDPTTDYCNQWEPK